MRPVLLRMAGFAAFREPAVVDFRDADYFALVGPTGSGKSTVIDAMTFALYGSVPRWDDRRAVAMALAPTTGRATVSLVFDAGDARYVAARELRRAASGAVNVKEARLERLADPRGTAEEDERTEPLASGGPAVTREVQELLGLAFEDFCTCVVLPQGDFADFLHASARDRQEKLEKILGLGVYERVKQRANQEASTAAQRVELLADQLGRYADATAEAEAAAADRVAALTALERTVAAAAPQITAAEDELAALRTRADRLHAERALLAAVAVPAGVAELDASASRATAAVREAAAAERAAEKADATAREAVAAGPDRVALERLREAHAELDTTLDELPALTSARARAAASYAAATAEVAAAADVLEKARTSRDLLRDAAAAAAAEVDRLVAEREQLVLPAPPPGLADLDGRSAAADLAARTAARELAAAEAADAAARASADAAPPRGPVEEARRHREEYRTLRERCAEAASTLVAAEKTAGAAAADAEAAGARLGEARATLDTLQRTDAAAALRPGLVVGDECPVCARTVATLPPQLPVADLDAARHGVHTAERAYERTRAAAGDAAAQVAVAAAERDRLDGEVARVGAAFAAALAAAGLAVAGLEVAAPGGPLDTAWDGGSALDAGLATALDPARDSALGAALDAALAERDRADRAVTDADTALRAARRARDAAAAAAEQARAAAAEAVDRLRAMREPLVALGAPAVAGPGDSAQVADAWRALADWVRAERDVRDAVLATRRAARATAAAELAAAEEAFGAAGREEARRRQAETAAARAEQEATGNVAAAERRIAMLRAELAAAPSALSALSAAQIAAELARAAALDARARAAAAALHAARDVRRGAEAAAAAGAEQVAAAWRVLRGARDPLVPLGAPALEGDALGPAWDQLLAWARTAAHARAAEIADVEAAAVAARDRRAALTGRLAEALATAGIDPARVDHTRTATGGADHTRTHPAGADTADTATGGAEAEGPDTVRFDTAGAALAVTAALGAARAARERVAERRREADDLRGRQATAQEEQQVARLLGQQLRSDRFPRWLVASALDTLVTDASTILADLSGGQFALTHDRGEFLVIDHADADVRRPIKTLSGGETFQASLALALALSAQMSGLAARGAARLESIFLDEGFGTLDESNLDVVATTLETLAAAGNRMVGVVTHVPALAERVPVRFAVRRDQRTATVEREDR
ncbi:MAG: AAA family ATPase [Pseudonocardia sp.]